MLSKTTKKNQKALSGPLHSKLKKIEGLFQDLDRNLRTLEGKMEFKDFSRTFQDMRSIPFCTKLLGWISTLRNCHLKKLVSLEGCDKRPHREKKKRKRKKKERRLS